nr:TVP38/TMEM64 family protein [Staphylococcus lugdunensis]
GTGITTLFTHPIRGILLILVTVVLWIVGKQVEKYFMGQSKEK